MTNLQVHWYRGQFLRPQHFQAQDQYWQQQIAIADGWLNPYSYGLQEFRYDGDALVAGTLKVICLKARLKSGVLVCIDEAQGDRPLEFECVKWLNEKNVQIGRAFIAIPRLSDSGSNVGDKAVRYSLQKRDYRDENGEGPTVEIDFRKSRVEIKLLTPVEEQPEERTSELLPIGQVRLADARSPHPSMADDFVPALLSIDAWPGLKREFVNNVYERVSDQRDRVATSLGPIRFGYHQLTEREQRRLSLLNALNIATSRLFILQHAETHPFHVYCQLADLVAHLSIFSPDLRSEANRDFWAYNHDKPRDCFYLMRDRIYELMRDMANVLRVDFQKHTPEIMFVTLNSEWFERDCVWYLGIDRGDVTDAQLRELEIVWRINDWMFDSMERLATHLIMQPDLLVRTRIDQALPDLPAVRHWTFYQVNRQASLAMQRIESQRDLGMKPWLPNVSRQQMKRINTDSITFEIAGAERDFRFALFGVRNR